MNYWKMSKISGFVDRPVAPDVLQKKDRRSMDGFITPEYLPDDDDFDFDFDFEEE